VHFAVRGRRANIDCVVLDKVRIINSEKLSVEISKQEKLLNGLGRILVRISGTEPKVRIMVEHPNSDIAELSAKSIEKVVYEIDKGK
jgi:phosphoglucosamine mutase